MSDQFVCPLLVAITVLAVALRVAVLRKRDRKSRGTASLQSPSTQPESVVSQAIIAELSSEQPKIVQEEKTVEQPLIAAPMYEGQTVFVETTVEKYFLRLRDSQNGIYDAVRVCKIGKQVDARFTMRFLGTLVPNVGMRPGLFVSGGYLSYRKVYAGMEFDEVMSPTVVRVLFPIDYVCKQAS